MVGSLWQLHGGNLGTVGEYTFDETLLEENQKEAQVVADYPEGS